MTAKKRTAKIKRKTKETDIELTLDLDGAGKVDAKTGVGFLDHMLDHLGKHGVLDITVSAGGDLKVDDHHTTEDVAICLGEALGRALSDKAGIRRYGWASVPMDILTPCSMAARLFTSSKSRRSGNALISIITPCSAAVLNISSRLMAYGLRFWISLPVG